jgi:DNA-binding transcriptional regulator LsrR (DeoR family)
LTAADLEKIPTVIGIASESDKAMAVLGALRTGIIDILATSESNAKLVLAYDSQSPVPARTA